MAGIPAQNSRCKLASTKATAEARDCATDTGSVQTSNVHICQRSEEASHHDLTFATVLRFVWVHK